MILGWRVAAKEGVILYIKVYDRNSQNENIAAFFLLPKRYTSACEMKRPTVIPIVTVTMAVPICVALFCAVIPPASDRPD